MEAAKIEREELFMTIEGGKKTYTVADIEALPPGERAALIHGLRAQTHVVSDRRRPGILVSINPIVHRALLKPRHNLFDQLTRPRVVAVQKALSYWRFVHINDLMRQVANHHRAPILIYNTFEIL